MIELQARRCVLKFDGRDYGEDDLRAAALALGERAAVTLRRGTAGFRVELRPSGRARAAELASDFAAEALTQAYRRKALAAAGESAAQALAATLARGLCAVPPDPLEQLEPQVAADRERETRELLERARRQMTEGNGLTPKDMGRKP